MIGYISTYTWLFECRIYHSMVAYMGHHIIKWAKLNFVARHYDPYVQAHKGHYVATHILAKTEVYGEESY